MSKKLLFSVTKKDFEITYFSGSGAGGQHRNKHQNCVRIKHPESGIIATGTKHKSREQNLNDAFKSITSKKEFKDWLKREAAKYLVSEEELKRRVNEAMSPENIKIEYYDPE